MAKEKEISSGIKFEHALKDILHNLAKIREENESILNSILINNPSVPPLTDGQSLGFRYEKIKGLINDMTDMDDIIRS